MKLLKKGTPTVVQHNDVYLDLKRKAIVGRKVVWNDDGYKCRGVILKVHNFDKPQPTHLGSLYVCEFQDGDGDSYTRTFDDYSLGRELNLLAFTTEIQTVE
jgi:hypothetical protein